MTVVNFCPFSRGLAGVTSSSPPPRCCRAGAPSTLIEETSSPVRSRLKRASRAVAVAVIVAVPSSCLAPSGVMVSLSP